MSLAHENRRVWQRYRLAENRRSIEDVLETLCGEPIYKLMPTNITIKGREQVSDFYARLFAGIPEANFEVINVFASDEGVVEEVVLRGVQRGELFGIAPTGREIVLPMAIVFAIGRGQILGMRWYFDLASLARELGVPVEQVVIGPA